jgi:hypothetical protein
LGSSLLTHDLSLNLLRRIAAYPSNLINPNTVLRHRIRYGPMRLNSRSTELRVGALDKLLHLVIAEASRLSAFGHPHRKPCQHLSRSQIGHQVTAYKK